MHRKCDIIFCDKHVFRVGYFRTGGKISKYDQRRKTQKPPT